MNWILTFFLFAFSIQVLDAACTGNSLGSVSQQQCETSSLPPGCAIDSVEIQNVPNDGASLRTSYSQYPITFNHTGVPVLLSLRVLFYPIQVILVPASLNLNVQISD